MKKKMISLESPQGSRRFEDLSGLIKEMSLGRIPVLSEKHREEVEKLISGTVLRKEFLGEPADPNLLVVFGVVSERIRLGGILNKIENAIHIPSFRNGRKRRPTIGDSVQATERVAKVVNDLRIAIAPPEFVLPAFGFLEHLGDLLIAIRRNFMHERGKRCMCQIKWAELQTQIEDAIDWAESSHRELVRMANELKARHELSTTPGRPKPKREPAPAASDTPTTDGQENVGKQ